MAEQSGTSGQNTDAARQDLNRRVRRTEQVQRAQDSARNGNPTNPVGDIGRLLRGEDVDERPAPDEGDDAPAPGSPAEPGADEGRKEGDDADEGAEGSRNEPATLDDVAKRLGLSKSELNAVEVAVGHERMSLGELKAKLPELARLDKSRTEHDDAKSNWELQRIDSLRRIGAIVERFPPGSVPQPLLAAIEADHAHNRQRESDLLATARKEWSDPVYAATERKSMTALANRYGITAGEVGSIMDHRQVLLLQDFAALQAKFDAIKAQARRAETPDIGAARTEGAPQSGPRRTNTRADVAARVGALLRR